MNHANGSSFPDYLSTSPWDLSGIAEANPARHSQFHVEEVRLFPQRSRPQAWSRSPPARGAEESIAHRHVFYEDSFPSRKSNLYPLSAAKSPRYLDMAYTGISFMANRPLMPKKDEGSSHCFWGQDLWSALLKTCFACFEFWVAKFWLCLRLELFPRISNVNEYFVSCVFKIFWQKWLVDTLHYLRNLSLRWYSILRWYMHGFPVSHKSCFNFWFITI